MEAAAAASGGEPPEELWYAWQAKRWGFTPTEVDEQPAGLLSRMAIAWDAYEAAQKSIAVFKNVPASDKADWLRKNPGLANEYAKVSRLEEKYKAWRKMKD